MNTKKEKGAAGENGKTQRNYRDIDESRFVDLAERFNRDCVPKSTSDATGAVTVYHYGIGKTKFNICYDRRAGSVQITASRSAIDEIEAVFFQYGLTQTKAEPDIAETIYKDGYSLSRYERERFLRGVSELKKQAFVAKTVCEESNADTAQHMLKVTVIARDKSRTIVQYAVKRKVMQIQGKSGVLADLVQTIFSADASEKDIIEARVQFNKTRFSAGERSQPEQGSPEKAVAVQNVPERVAAKQDNVALQNLPHAVSKKDKHLEPAQEDEAISPAVLTKTLTKALPNGIKYLSKQSQTYLYYTLIDLESKLRNYAGLLATAYQGLENFISNLQIAEGIKVKLIGQAYEKSDGAYSLKASYRRRVKSVIYNEVMSALYTEYFDHRHYYTHSDNSSDTARLIGSQSDAKKEFSRLISVLEYNATKLSEIGFKLDSREQNPINN